MPEMLSAIAYDSICACTMLVDDLPVLTPAGPSNDATAEFIWNNGAWGWTLPASGVSYDIPLMSNLPTQYNEPPVNWDAIPDYSAGESWLFGEPGATRVTIVPPPPTNATNPSIIFPSAPSVRTAYPPTVPSYVPWTADGLPPFFANNEFECWVPWEVPKIGRRGFGDLVGPIGGTEGEVIWVRQTRFWWSGDPHPTCLPMETYIVNPNAPKGRRVIYPQLRPGVSQTPLITQIPASPSYGSAFVKGTIYAAIINYLGSLAFPIVADAILPDCKAAVKKLREYDAQFTTFFRKMKVYSQALKSFIIAHAISGCGITANTLKQDIDAFYWNVMRWINGIAAVVNAADNLNCEALQNFVSDFGTKFNELDTKRSEFRDRIEDLQKTCGFKMPSDLTALTNPDFLANPFPIDSGVEKVVHSNSVTKHLKFDFSGLVNIDAAGITVKNQDNTSFQFDLTTETSSCADIPVTVATLDFSQYYTRLPDGLYTVSVQDWFIADGLSNPLLQYNPTATFHVLFGDYDGDGIVGPADQTAFTSTLGLSSEDEGFIPEFDFDGNGVVDENNDASAFFANYGVNVNANPTVSSVVVNNDGNPQRSWVTLLMVEFNTVVTVDNGAFSLDAYGTPFAPAAVYFGQYGGKTRAFIYLKQVGNNFTTIGDGVFTLVVHHEKVKTMFQKQMLNDYTFKFHRLFGDCNGDAHVNNWDLGVITAGINTSAGNPLYKFYLDYDQDGDLDGVDFYYFGLRYNTYLQY